MKTHAYLYVFNPAAERHVRGDTCIPLTVDTCVKEDPATGYALLSVSRDSETLAVVKDSAVAVQAEISRMLAINEGYAEPTQYIDWRHTTVRNEAEYSLASLRTSQPLAPLRPLQLAAKVKHHGL